MFEDSNFLRSFAKPPDVNLDDIAQYFNLEYGFVEDEASEDRFTASDFTFLGVFVVDGYETLYWSVRGRAVYATALPYADSFILLMATNPPPAGTG
jgi:hypothetical protein